MVASCCFTVITGGLKVANGGLLKVGNGGLTNGGCEEDPLENPVKNALKSQLNNPPREPFKASFPQGGPWWQHQQWLRRKSSKGSWKE